MKLAVLGTESNAVCLAQEALAQGHTIEWVDDSQTIGTGGAANVVGGSNWEVVVDRGAFDGVIVGRDAGSTELRAEQLKRIAAEAMPMLAVHPARSSVLPYYEVDMTRREMHGVVRHYNPIAGHPVLEELASWVRMGHPTVGAIHQVTCERRVSDTARSHVTACLARDAEVLAAVAGDIKRVSAIGPKIDQLSFASLQVQMTCLGPASVRWSVGSKVGAEFDVALTLIGDSGTIVLSIVEPGPESPSVTWKLETLEADSRNAEQLEPFNPAAVAIDRLAAAINAPTSDEPDRRSTWDTATRSMEVVDAIELSLEKGRTLDVHQQELTERLAFRGTMAAMGCGLLLVGFIVFVVVSIFGTAEGEDRRRLIGSWPIILLAVLAFFLLLQCAPLLVSKRPPSDKAKKSGENEPPR